MSNLRIMRLTAFQIIIKATSFASIAVARDQFTAFHYPDGLLEVLVNSTVRIKSASIGSS